MLDHGDAAASLQPSCISQVFTVSVMLSWRATPHQEGQTMETHHPLLDPRKDDLHKYGIDDHAIPHAITVEADPKVWDLDRRPIYKGTNGCDTIMH